MEDQNLREVMHQPPKPRRHTDEGQSIPPFMEVEVQPVHRRVSFDLNRNVDIGYDAFSFEEPPRTRFPVTPFVNLPNRKTITRRVGRRLNQQSAPPSLFSIHSPSARKLINFLSCGFPTRSYFVAFAILIMTMTPFILHHFISNAPPMLTPVSLLLPNDSAALQTNISIHPLYDDSIRKVSGLDRDYTYAEQIILTTEYRLQSCLKRTEEYVQKALQFEEEISRLREKYPELLLKERNTRDRLVLVVNRFKAEHLCIPMRTVYVIAIILSVLVTAVSVFRLGVRLNGLDF